MEFIHYYSSNKASVIGSVPTEYVDNFLKNVDNSDKTIDLVFTIDTSGSMSECLGMSYGGAMPSFLPHFGGHYKKTSTKSKIVCDALMKCIEYLKVLAKNKNKIRLSVISFKEESEVVIDKLVVDESEECSKILSKLEYYLQPEGGTNMYKALLKSKEQIEEILNTNSIENVSVFMMTDGHNSQTEENPAMVDFFKSCEYKDKFIGIGIGNVSDYDNILMNQLFDNLKGSPSSEELTDNIISDTFGACSTVFKDFQIIFKNIKDCKYYTPLEFKKTEDSNLVFTSKNVDFSQKYMISFENESDFESPITMEVSYYNVVTKEQVNQTILLNTGDSHDVSSLERINVLCKLIDEFKKMTVSFIKYEDNKVATTTMLEKFADWKESDRTGLIGELWSANETIVKNHKNELDKYKNVELYAQYSNVLSKQASNTIGVGLAPCVSRAVSGGVVQQYSGSGATRQKSNPVPDIDEESIYNMPQAINPVLNRLHRQNAVVHLSSGSSSGGIEEDGGYVQKEELDIA